MAPDPRVRLSLLSNIPRPSIYDKGILKFQQQRQIKYEKREASIPKKKGIRFIDQDEESEELERSNLVIKDDYSDEEIFGQQDQTITTLDKSDV